MFSYKSALELKALKRLQIIILLHHRQDGSKAAAFLCPRDESGVSSRSLTLRSKMHYSLLRNPIIAASILFLSLLFSSSDSMAQIQLAWDANTASDLAGYKVYYGTASGKYGRPLDVKKMMSSNLIGLIPGVKYYFVVTAYNKANIESSFSNEVYGTITETVLAPTVLSGSTSGITGTSYTYTAGGASSNLSHSMQYQFDWKGDGTDLSSWGSATQSKTWTSSGRYIVRARVRCSTDPSMGSSWYGSFAVTVNDPPTAPVTLQANDFATKTTGIPKPNSYCISSNGYIEDSVKFPVSGNYSLIITAYGSLAAGIWPNMAILIDQKKIGNATVNSGTSSTYVIKGHISAGIHKVAIAFTNDFYNPPADRNLYAVSLSIQ
jgi:hypothetical protein